MSITPIHDILKEESSISLLTVNKLLYNIFSYITETDIANPTMQYASNSVSGALQFSDSLSSVYLSSGENTAISPSLLWSEPKVFNEYYSNSITPSASNTMINSLGTITAQYLVLANKNVFIFGEITTPTTYNNLTLNLTELFSKTPNRLQTLYYINVGCSELTNTLSPMSIITSIIQETDISVSIIGNIQYNNGSSTNRKLNWFAIGKLV